MISHNENFKIKTSGSIRTKQLYKQHKLKFRITEDNLAIKKQIDTNSSFLWLPDGIFDGKTIFSLKFVEVILATGTFLEINYSLMTNHFQVVFKNSLLGVRMWKSFDNLCSSWFIKN